MYTTKEVAVQISKWRCTLHTKKRWHAEILNKTSLALMFTSDIFYIFFSFIIKSSIYAIFHFDSLRDRIFILFLLMTWPEYLFLKKTSRSDPYQNQMAIPAKRYIGRSRGGQAPLFVLDYRLVKHISSFNRIFQFRPCHF
jgi:hypothetical protein